MKNELVINISNLSELPNNFKTSTILDLSGAIDCHDKIIPSDFFDKSIIYPLMLQKYRLFAEAIINVNNLLNIKINDTSIYWLSACAVKYHSRHWAKDFFLLLTILEQCRQKIEQYYSSLVIILPSKTKSLKYTIEELLQKQEYKLPTQITCDKQPIYKPTLSAIVKSFFKEIKQLKQLKATSEEPNNIILFTDNTNKSEFITSTQKLFTKNNKILTTLPYYWKTNSLPTFFLKSKPSNFQCIKILTQLIKAYNHINKLPHSKISEGNHQISTSFFNNELKLTLRKNINLFIYQQWLNNYFSTLKQPTSIFFEDEFYEIGRAISHAAKPFKNITTYGMQHAHFMEMHTVYSIYDKELEKGLPIPNHFITWGEGYNQLFLNNNSLFKSYTKALGNPIYVNQNLTITYSTSIENVLWCLTTKECMDIEWECIKNEITKPNFNLNIRLHPLNHISEIEVNHKLKGIKFNYQNEGSIQHAIVQNDLIISSAHSSTFLDALIAKKYCVRITSRFWNGTIQTDNDYLRTIKNEKEFQNSLLFFSTNMSTEDIENNILTLSDSKWNDFINSLN